MSRLFGAAWVIARRDYVATVFSRIFILFLATPIFPVLFGVMFGAIGADQDHGAAHRPVVALIADASATRAVVEAHDRLAKRLGDDILPDLAPLTPVDGRAGAHLARELLVAPGRRYVAVLGGSLDVGEITVAGLPPLKVAADRVIGAGEIILVGSA